MTRAGLMSRLSGFGVQQLAEFCIERSRLCRHRPLTGGTFGFGAFSMSSMPFLRNGMDRVTYAVVDSTTGFPFGSSDTLRGALASARQVLSCVDRTELAVVMGAVAKEIARIELERDREIQKRRAEQFEENRRRFKARADQSTTERVPSISRRRRALFEKSEGRCHYCACELRIDGRWHVEHMIPRALGGESIDTNLVAACAPCNHKKRDLTDHEFFAKRALEAGGGQ